MVLLSRVAFDSFVSDELVEKFSFDVSLVVVVVSFFDVGFWVEELVELERSGLVRFSKVSLLFEEDPESALVSFV